MPTALELEIDRRLPDSVEVGAYYVVAEALTNAAKHARASAVEVCAHATNNHLRLEIGDDGIGGAARDKGTGLTGLADRVEALGGEMTIQSPPGVEHHCWSPSPSNPIKHGMVHDQHCDEHITGPESSAARVALWRALHLEADAPPHVFSDGVGLQLLAPDADWRCRAEMDERASRRPRASTVSRARFIEELIENQAGHGVNQYVILGAGLDTFAERRPEIASRLTVFEVDQHQPQAWKRQRLNELGFGIPQWLRLVAVDFEAGGSLWERLTDAGFDTGRWAVIASTGVSMYLSRDAIVAMLREISTHAAAGSTLVVRLWCRCSSLTPRSGRAWQR